MAEPTRITVNPLSNMPKLETANAWQPEVLDWLKNAPSEWYKSYFQPPAVPIEPNAAGKTPEQKYGDDKLNTLLAAGDLASMWPGMGVIKGAALAVPGVKAAAKKLATREALSPLPKAGIGHNMPPPGMEIGAEDIVQQAVPKERSWAQQLPRPQPANRSTEIPDIRNLATTDAVDQARLQPHLIKAGDQSEGFYVGGPREVLSKKDLNALRKEFDDYIAADPRGGDWYDRYRSAMDWVTGGDPLRNKWMSAQQGQWSAGVSPDAELQFALREKNAAIAGMPVKAARPAQHEAHMRALQNKDIGEYQLGDKTGEYANLINPDRPGPPGATGVNDFRHARNWKYTEPGGEAQKGALTDAQHKFLDYETALAVDRANKTKLGGRDDWTGEKLQAAPWVRQKAQDIMSRNPALTYDEAFARANRQIGDFFPKHRMFATYEHIPGSETNHLPGLLGASKETKEAYSLDPRHSWMDPKTGRDVLYSEMGIPGTGNYMAVEPTVRTQGIFVNPKGQTEFNPGFSALPLGAFDTTAAVKGIPPAEKAILSGVEATRGLIDAQMGSAAHKPFIGGTQKLSNSWTVPREGASNPDELVRLREAGRKIGLGDVSDTGKGVTLTSFYPKPGEMTRDAAKTSAEEIKGITGSAPQRAAVDSVYVDFAEPMATGKSGAVTTEALKHINVTPEIRASLDSNPNIPRKALEKMELDAEWSKTHGATSEAYTNLRKIIGEGPGWIGRLEAALKRGDVILPALAALMVPAAAASLQQGAPQQELRQ